MKAIVCNQYGQPDVLRFEEVEKPTPKDDQVLIKVEAASVNAYDWHMLTADIFLVRLGAGLLKPNNTRPGADIAGRIEAVGKDVTQFKPGDEVYGDIGAGGFAEYACTREKNIALKPINLTFEEAAAVPMAGLTALQALRDAGQIELGQKVLIHGASGGVGTFAVQIAKHYGAEVTAVCSPRGVEQARALGADHVIDYTRTDFSKAGQRYDLVVAANGRRSIFAYRRALTERGTFVLAGGAFSQIFQVMLLGRRLSKPSSQQLKFLSAKVVQSDLIFLKELIEIGQVKPVIDRRYKLSETAEALRYLGAGHAKGKVVITMSES